jgi:hypothetical protein
MTAFNVWHPGPGKSGTAPLRLVVKEDKLNDHL